jgi:uncharacterized protein YaaN involved in tellurite resistance
MASASKAAVQRVTPAKADIDSELRKARDLAGATRKSYDELDGQVAKTIKTIFDVKSDKDSTQLEHVYELHEKYSNLGADALKGLMPDLTNESFNVSMKELDYGSEASKDISKTLAKVSDSLADLDASKISHRPSNALLRAVYDPVRGFFNRSRKAGAVIESCMKTLTKYELSLISDIAAYNKDRVRAAKCAEVATQQAELADEIIKELRKQLASMTFDESNIDLKNAIESEVLATLERRKTDLLEIATGQATYIASIDLLSKTHYKILEIVKSTKNTAVIQFRSAVQVAHGIYVQETARKAVLTTNKASSDLDMDNAVNLKESVKNISDVSHVLHDNIDSMSAALNTVLEAHDAFKSAEASSADVARDAAERAQKQLRLMNKKLEQSKILDDTRNDLLAKITSSSHEDAADGDVQ